MWHTEYAIDSDLAPSVIWRALTALETGRIPKANGDRHELEGPFEQGGGLISSSVGIDPVRSTFTELVENERLAMETDFRGLILVLRHTLQPLAEGGTRLVRGLDVTASSPAAAAQEAIAGPRISADYPEALVEVVEVARTLR